MTDEPPIALLRGDVVWAALGPTRGREQSGHRPAVIIASNGYLETVNSLAIVLPVTASDRGWSNHVLLEGPTGLDQRSFAMTEQIQTISRSRITGVAGALDRRTMTAIETYLAAFLDL